MLKVLISEDNIYKFNDIQNLLLKNYKDISIKHITYAKGTIIDLLNNDYDILIQDMQLPLHSNDRFVDINGGIYVLNQLQRRNKLIYSIICSSSNDSLEKLKNHNLNNISFIKYDTICIDWENDLIKLINKYLEGK